MSKVKKKRKKPWKGLLLFASLYSLLMLAKWYLFPVASQPHSVRCRWLWILLGQHNRLLQRDLRVSASHVTMHQVGVCNFWFCVHHRRLRLCGWRYLYATALRMRERTERDSWWQSTYSRDLWRSTSKWFQVFVSSIARYSECCLETARNGRIHIQRQARKCDSYTMHTVNVVQSSQSLKLFCLRVDFHCHLIFTCPRA